MFNTNKLSYRNQLSQLGTVFSIILMTLVGALIIFPVFMAAITSFKTMAEIQSPIFSFWPRQWKFSNYPEAMGRGDWPRYFWNSTYVMLVSVILSLAINSLAGYAFARLNFKGRDTLFIMSLVGLMIPPLVTVVPLFIIMRHWPLAGGNNLFGLGGVGLVNTHASLILYFMANSFGVFLFRQYYLNFPKSLDDAARIDGLGSFKIFLYIYMPLGKAVFAAYTALRVTRVWNEYTWPLVITITNDMRTVQLALTLYKDEFQIEWNLLMAATVLITLPLVIVYLFAQRHFIEGIVTTGTKG
jgi:multiple sugar transport system permease protein